MRPLLPALAAGGTAAALLWLLLGPTVSPSGEEDEGPSPGVERAAVAGERAGPLEVPAPPPVGLLRPGETFPPGGTGGRHGVDAMVEFAPGTGRIRGRDLLERLEGRFFVRAKGEDDLDALREAVIADEVPPRIPLAILADMVRSAGFDVAVHDPVITIRRRP
jgi:hypothetical protein